MSEGSQILVPPSFTALFVPPGRIKPTESYAVIEQRYELCEDFAQMLVDQARAKHWELGITEADVLERCLTSRPPACRRPSAASWWRC